MSVIATVNIDHISIMPRDNRSQVYRIKGMPTPFLVFLLSLHPRYELRWFPFPFPIVGTQEPTIFQSTSSPSPHHGVYFPGHHELTGTASKTNRYFSGERRVHLYRMWMY
ncbi:hypothetical protein ABVK25_004118 [Lepraria finkii]|uniref:Uncharacterized protein n=1 Tax=Lepraria finkii TaxID=1340010 RepID=A0ABR4BDE6_9LECA